MNYTGDPALTDEEGYVMRLLVNGWVANRTVANEFRINNGERHEHHYSSDNFGAGGEVKR